MLYTYWEFQLAPGDVKYASETAHVESVKLPLLSCVKNPGLAAVQQCAQNASSVDLDLGIFRQLSFLLDHTLLFSLEMVVAALPMRLFSSDFRERVSEMRSHWQPPVHVSRLQCWEVSPHSEP